VLSHRVRRCSQGVRMGVLELAIHDLFAGILGVTGGSIACLTVFAGRHNLLGSKKTVLARHRVTSFASFQVHWRVVVGDRGDDGWRSSGRCRRRH
jgi:hypothetical protein